MRKFIIAGAAGVLITSSSASALAASAADCQALFDKADINRDGALQTNEASLFLDAMTQAQVQPQDATKVSSSEFMTACQKDAFANINPALGTSQAAGSSATNSGQTTSQSQQTAQPDQSIASPAGFMVSNLMGANVTSPSGENIGEVKDVVLSPQGDATHVIIDIGDKDIEIERSKLDISATESGMKIAFSGTQADLAQLPAVNTGAAQQETATAPAPSQEPTGTAQTTTTAQQPSTAQQPAAPEVSETIAAPEGFMASNLIGATVKNAQDENVGEIKDIVFSDRGEPTHVIIDIGDKDVEVEKSKLDISASEDGLKVLLNGTQADLAQLPAVNVGGAEQQTAATSSQPAQQTTTEQPAQQTTEQPAQQTATGEQPAQETTTAKQQVQQSTTTEQPGQQTATTEQPAQQTTTAEQPAQETTTAEQPATSEAPAETTASVEQPSTGETPQAQPAEQALAIPEGLMVSDLIGATIYSPNDEKLGEVNDLSLSSGAGQPPQVIIGVGGFFGIGEKDVSVDMSRLKFTTTDDGLKIMLDATKQDLESLAANSSQ